MLDCFMGSGTTRNSYREYGKKFYQDEIDESYFKISKTKLKMRNLKLFYFEGRKKVFFFSSKLNEPQYEAWQFAHNGWV